MTITLVSRLSTGSNEQARYCGLLHLMSILAGAWPDLQGPRWRHQGFWLAQTSDHVSLCSLTRVKPAPETLWRGPVPCWGSAAIFENLRGRMLCQALAEGNGDHNQYVRHCMERSLTPAMGFLPTVKQSSNLMSCAPGWVEPHESDAAAAFFLERVLYVALLCRYNNFFAPYRGEIPCLHSSIHT